MLLSFDNRKNLHTMKKSQSVWYHHNHNRIEREKNLITMFLFGCWLLLVNLFEFYINKILCGMMWCDLKMKKEKKCQPQNLCKLIKIRFFISKWQRTMSKLFYFYIPLGSLLIIAAAADCRWGFCFYKYARHINICFFFSRKPIKNAINDFISLEKKSIKIKKEGYMM